jgi:4-hydroxy-4-methyl-2-oxoglutarate aldolase
LVLGDDDGVVLVPAARAGDIFTLAETIRDTERRQADPMRRGVSLRSQVQIDVYLAHREKEAVPEFPRSPAECGRAIEE